MKKPVKIVGVEHPIVQKKINRSLKLSVREGGVASASFGFGGSYLSPFALAMNATSSQIGILYAIISLLPSLIQIKASDLIRKFSRKSIVLWTVMAQVLLWIPIIATGILFYLGVPHMVWALIGFAGLYYIAGAINFPAWFSWMGSLVSEEKRGRYFSKRNRVAGFSGLVALVVAAVILNRAKSIGASGGNVLGYTLLGFGLLFLLASATGIWEWSLFLRQYEPRIKVRKKDCFSFWQFLRKAPNTPLGRFSLFKGALAVVISIASPFWVVYMLRNLGFSYIWFMAITVSGIVFQLAFLPLLGKISDKFGNISLMKISSGMMFLAPMLWIASALINSGMGVKIYLLFVPQIISGFAWAGYNLATNNYVFDAVNQRKRGFGVSYMNLLVGVGIFVGASIGSLIASIGVSFMDTILFIFLVSGIGRLLVAVIGIRYLKEVRHVSKFSSYYLIKEFRPMQGIVREARYLEHVVKKVEHYI